MELLTGLAGGKRAGGYLMVAAGVSGIVSLLVFAWRQETSR